MASAFAFRRDDPERKRRLGEARRPAVVAWCSFAPPEKSMRSTSNPCLAGPLVTAKRTNGSTTSMSQMCPTPEVAHPQYNDGVLTPIPYSEGTFWAFLIRDIKDTKQTQRNVLVAWRVCFVYAESPTTRLKRSNLFHESGTAGEAHMSLGFLDRFRFALKFPAQTKSRRRAPAEFMAQSPRDADDTGATSSRETEGRYRLLVERISDYAIYMLDPTIAAM